MSKFRDDEEKEYVMSKLTNKNKYVDIANFFIMVDEVNSEDIFEFYFLTTDNKFYVKVFNYIFNFLMKQLKRKRFEKYMGSIIERMYIEEFVNVKRISKKNHVNRDAIMSLFLKDILLTLVEQSNGPELLYTINMLLDCAHIPVEMVVDLLKSDITFISSYVIEDLAYSRVLPVKDLLNMLEMRFEHTTKEDIKDILRLLYTTEDTLIDILLTVMDMYYLNTKRNGKITVRTNLTGKTKRFYNFVREFLTELFVSELECDIWAFVDRSENIYSSEGDVYFLGIYSKIKEFLNSNERRVNMVRRFNTILQEEPKDFLSLQQRVDLNMEIEAMRYESDLEILDSFGFFIRLMNLTRFGFISHPRSVPDVRRFIKERLEDIPGEYITTAIDNKTYNFLFNYN